MIAIVGPTASGKTALALELARQLNGEIVSADSRQIYRGMDIGTAKPTKAEMSAVPHHLIDIKYPNEDYSVAGYKRDAIAAIKEILRRHRLPILIGGTGLYIDAVVKNLDIPAVQADPALRRKLDAEIARDGLEAVFKKLVALDPEAAYVVDPKNPRRVVRALEVAFATGRPFTAQRKKNEPLFETLKIGLVISPAVLRERIDARINQMIKDGLIEEVKELVERYGANCAAFDAIGYRELVPYLAGQTTLDTSLTAMKLNTWHYAKRQLTWFKKDPAVHWVADGAQAAELAQRFIEDSSRKDL